MWREGCVIAKRMHKLKSQQENTESKVFTKSTAILGWYKLAEKKKYLQTQFARRLQIIFCTTKKRSTITADLGWLFLNSIWEDCTKLKIFKNVQEWSIYGIFTSIKVIKHFWIVLNLIESVQNCSNCPKSDLTYSKILRSN